MSKIIGNFKVWLKFKLIRFLNIDTIQSNIYNIQDYMNLNNAKFKKIEHNEIVAQDKIRHIQDSVSVLRNTIQNVVHVGSDVYHPPDGRSWAVICIEGKINIVKFVELNRNDAREVMDFLKRYEAGRHCVDTPYKEMFYDGFFKF